MTEREELKRRIELKFQGMQAAEAEHRRWMQAEGEKIKKLRLRLRELENESSKAA